MAQSHEKKRFDKKALEKLSSYAFPGNIRELRNIVDQAVLLADETVIYESDLPVLDEFIGEDNASMEGKYEEEALTTSRVNLSKGIMTLDEVEDAYLAQVASSFKGDINSLADALGVSTRTLYRKLKKAGVKELN